MANENFDKWYEQLKQAMVKDFGFAPNKPDSFYGSQDSWQDYFDDGYEPYAAIEDCLSCAD